MTVKQLIKKLQKCDPEATVIMYNSELYVEGMYTVTDVADGADGYVEIETNYEKRLW